MYKIKDESVASVQLYPSTIAPTCQHIYHLIKFDPDWVKEKTFLCILKQIFIIPFHYYSIGNTKFQANPLFIFFHSKNRQINFSRRKPMAAKHTLMDVSRSNFT